MKHGSSAVSQKEQRLFAVAECTVFIHQSKREIHGRKAGVDMKYLSQESTQGLQLGLFARLQTHTKGLVGIFAYLSRTCATLFAIASFPLN